MLNKSLPAGLTCTELCGCSDDDEPCENALQEDDSDEYIDDNDESDNSYDSARDDDNEDNAMNYAFITLLRGD